MINVQSIIDFLFSYAPLSLQESYDNSGLICGDGQKNCTGIICCLDVTDAVLNEAINAGANLIISHHPLIFKPLRSITPSKNVDRLLIKAIKNDMSIFAIHTNYDNIIGGVNRAFALSLGLKEPTFRILSPLTGRLAKLYTYVPPGHIDSVKNAIFSAGAGKIGLYDECGFQISGTGSFRPLPGSNPFIGKPAGPREEVNEIKLEVIFPVWQKNRVLKALFESHPYEEVAYEIITTENPHQEVGSGLIAEFESPLNPPVFLEKVSTALHQPFLRHSELVNVQIRKVALCGGSGSFLIPKAIENGADAFITADLKYHDFFEAEGKILLVDAGHFETEIPAVEQLTNILQEKFPTFAVLKTKVNTNPVNYFRN